MITLYLHLPGSPDLEHGAYALSDSEAISLPARYYGPDTEAKIHLSNTLAFDAFRLAVALGHIPPENIRWRAFDDKGRHSGTINQYGVPRNDHADHDRWPCTDWHLKLSEEIILSTVHKRRAQQRERITPIITRIRRTEENCKPEGSSDENPSSD